MPRSFLVKKKDGKTRKVQGEVRSPLDMLAPEGAPRRLLTSLSSTGSSPGQLSEDSGIEEPPEPVSSPELRSPSPGLLLPRVSEASQRISWSVSPRVLTYVETDDTKTLESPPPTELTSPPRDQDQRPYWSDVGPTSPQRKSTLSLIPSVTTNSRLERPPRPRIWRSPGIDDGGNKRAIIEENEQQGVMMQEKPNSVPVDDVFDDVDGSPLSPVNETHTSTKASLAQTSVTSSYEHLIRRHEPVYVGKTPSPRFHPYGYYSRHSTPIRRELPIASPTFQSPVATQRNIHQTLRNDMPLSDSISVIRKLSSPGKPERRENIQTPREVIAPAGPYSPSWDIENRPVVPRDLDNNPLQVDDTGMRRLPFRPTEISRELSREALKVTHQAPLSETPPMRQIVDNRYGLPGRNLSRDIYQQVEPFREIAHSEPQRVQHKPHLDPLRQLNTIDPLRGFPQEDSSQRGHPFRDYNLGATPRGDPPRFQCEDCHKSYATYSGLTKHRQFHCAAHVKKEFSCKHCNKTYVSLGALKMHIRTHTLPCKCHLCGKAFSRPWLLQGHIRTHTGEKPFQCQHCSRSFADRSNLRAHLQTHTDIKKYSCKRCAKTFSRMSLLLKHEDGGCNGICIPCA